MNHTRPHYGPGQLGKVLGWTRSEVNRAWHSDTIAGPDRQGRRWSATLVERIAADVAARQLTPPPPFVGAKLAATYIRVAIGAPVSASEVRALAEIGVVPVAGRYHGSATYGLSYLTGLRQDPAACQRIRQALGYPPTKPTARPDRSTPEPPPAAGRQQSQALHRLRRAGRAQPQPTGVDPLAELRRLVARHKATDHTQEAP